MALHTRGEQRSSLLSGRLPSHSVSQDTSELSQRGRDLPMSSKRMLRGTLGRRPTPRAFSRRKRAAAVLVPMAATLASITMAARPAAAGTYDTQVPAGEGTTCNVRTTWEYPYRNDNQLGRATTVVTGGTGINGALCTNPFLTAAYVAATWLDPNGNADQSNYTVGNVSVDARFAPIGSQFHTYHYVYFYFCGCYSPIFEHTK